MNQFTFQSHRGARGLMPENTVPAFLKSLEYGVTTFELDVVISNDQQVVVSHEGWFSHLYCSKPNGEPVLETEEKSLRLYDMTYNRIRQYDCGRRQNPKFPQQQTFPAYKPLLKEVIEVCDQYVAQHQLPKVFYNIEVKTEGEEGDFIFQPPPAEFAQLVYDLIIATNIAGRVLVQSFDVRIVQAFKQINPSLPLSLLVDNDKSLEWNLQELGFLPNVYAPYYKKITPELLKKVHQKGILLITWTVNELADIQRLLEMGVDAVITDYPNLKLELEKEMKELGKK
ncbi:MAG: glycerophosphodiester phosphodiesterase family protein [Chitinophagales bacterium]